MRVKANNIYLNSNKDSKLKGYADVSFNDVFMVKGFNIFEGKDENGKDAIKVSMPQAKTRTGDFVDIAFPTTKEFYQVLQEKVVPVFLQAQEKGENIVNGMLKSDWDKLQEEKTKTKDTEKSKSADKKKDAGIEV